MPENKVIFGLKNAYYALLTEGTDGKYTYDTPAKLPGATELKVEVNGDSAPFYADDTLYYTSVSNQGYTATLSVANIPDQFRQDVLGETLGATDKVLTESSAAKLGRIAFLFEFDGDVKAIRHAFYNCTVVRPGLASQSKSDKTEPGTTELTITAAPRPYDNVVKRSTTADTPAETYDTWFTTVFEPVVAG